MAPIEWLIVAIFLTLLTISGIYCKKYIKGVTDWLVAGRGCGRYLGATAGEAASIGAITLIAYLQAAYVGGPVAWWIILVTVTLYLIISVTGWGIYRLRETRVLTINELLERRYSRKLRIFCGTLCFVSGVLNMGIFPIVTGRFLVYFCQLPRTIPGTGIGTIPVVTGLLVLVAVLLAFLGGQVSLILTDFMQWAVMMIMLIIVGIAAYRVVNWDSIGTALLAEPNPKEKLDPFLPTAANAFGLWYCLMYAFRAFYNVLSWAPGSNRGQTATGAKEAKRMWILSYVRFGANIGLLFAAVACFAFMKLPAFAEPAAKLQQQIAGIDNEMIRTQMVVPMFLFYILPVGIKGLFVAGMISASISTLDSYFLSWAAVFAQDVVVPWRKKTFTPTQRLWLLRWSLLGVAVFVYIFSILWKETEYIHMYFAITGSIYTGGAGAIILGALYWRRATTAGAWSAMIVGSSLAISGIVASQVFSTAPWWPYWLNGMYLSVLASLCAVVTFVVVSLVTNRTQFDLDTLLHRKPRDRATAASPTQKSGNILEIVVGTIAFGLLLGMLLAFWYTRTHDIAPQSWVTFWKIYSFVLFGYSIPVAVWFMIGSFVDIKRLFTRLRLESIDVHDDGQVHNDDRDYDHDGRSRGSRPHHPE